MNRIRWEGEGGNGEGAKWWSTVTCCGRVGWFYSDIIKRLLELTVSTELLWIKRSLSNSVHILTKEEFGQETTTCFVNGLEILSGLGIPLTYHLASLHGPLLIPQVFLMGISGVLVGVFPKDFQIVALLRCWWSCGLKDIRISPTMW